MGEATIMYLNLNNQQQLRLNKINGIKDYFIAEIKERESMNKRLDKYVATLDYFDKIVLSGTRVAFLLLHLLLLLVPL